MLEQPNHYQLKALVLLEGSLESAAKRLDIATVIVNNTTLDYTQAARLAVEALETVVFPDRPSTLANPHRQDAGAWIALAWQKFKRSL